MSVHSIFRLVSPYFRKKRFKAFLQKLEVSHSDEILDVGGYPREWTAYSPVAAKIDILNVHPIDFDGSAFVAHNITTFVGDGCKLDRGDGDYDIVFSNSVIEHLGSWEKQVAFASEVSRVGKRFWIQTPAREFFIEPHYIALIVHWLPKPVQRKLLRRFTLWGLISKPSQEKVDSMIDELRLLTYDEVVDLFPGCEIEKERFLHFFTKSYIAFQR
jgi:SAM-dependent methyltransferase